MARESSVFERLQSHRARREQFFHRFGALWPGTLLDAFDLLETHPLPRAEVAAITQATEAIVRIYQRVTSLLQAVPDETLLQMGFPRSTLGIIRTQTPGMSTPFLSRLDLVKTPTGYKMLEINADVPGLLVETFAVNAQVCAESGLVNPNRLGEEILADELRSAVKAGLEFVGKMNRESAYVVFTCCGKCRRDQDITLYLMNLLDLPQVQKRYVPLESLCADADGLYDPDGRRIDVLYRFYPLQFFRGGMFRAHQPGDAHLHTGQSLLDLVQNRRLAIINPPSAFLWENKAVQVVIWGLYEAGQYFTDEERALVERHMLPTYLDPVFGDEQYVIKPAYGSEGDTIKIVDPDSEEVLSSREQTYAEQTMIYQQYLELPLVETMTEDGMRMLRFLTSCFIIAGQPVGVILRAGNDITDESWWVAPVCLAD